MLVLNSFKQNNLKVILILIYVQIPILASFSPIQNDPVIFIDKRITTATTNFLIIDRFSLIVTMTILRQTDVLLILIGSQVFNQMLLVKIAHHGCHTAIKSPDSAQCITCLLFAGPKADNIWTTTCFTRWHSGHGVREIEHHERFHVTEKQKLYDFNSKTTVG
jgi:hypothetical protein